jgi:hypothetical protein
MRESFVSSVIFSVVCRNYLSPRCGRSASRLAAMTNIPPIISGIENVSFEYDTKQIALNIAGMNIANSDANTGSSV